MEPAEYEVRWMQKVQQQSTSPTYFERGRLVPVIGSASGGGGLGWSRELCSDGFITVGVDPTSINDFQSATLLNMHLAPAELWLMRNGVLVQRGPIIAYQVEGQSLIIFARGMLYYLRYMWVFEFDDYISIDQALIVKGLIDNYQAEDYGNFGLDTSAITSHGVTRTRKYRPREFINYASEIRAMGQADNGYDIDYDLSADKVKLWYPQKGVDRSQQNGVVDGVILDARGITNPNFADVVTAGKFGSSALVVGFDKEGGAYPYLAHNATTRAGFGLSFVSGQIDGVSGYAEVKHRSIENEKKIAETSGDIKFKQYFKAGSRVCHT